MLIQEAGGESDLLPAETSSILGGPSSILPAVSVSNLPNNNRMCVYCVFIVCLWEISSQLNQENGKSYGTDFFGKVQI